MKWEIDSVHSVVGFSAKYMMLTTVRGQFQKVNGVIEFDEQDPLHGSVEATIDATSITTQSQMRDTHLISQDFLHAEQYPVITFKSTRIEPGKGDETYRVIGDLTIRGVTREVALDATYGGAMKDPWGNTRAGFSAKTEISRKEFGLNWNQVLESGGVLVSDKITIELEVQAIQRAAVPAQA
jgi:polyisoprenoid-binding protein YceI